MLKNLTLKTVPKMINFITKMSSEDVLGVILLILLVVALYFFIDNEMEKRKQKKRGQPRPR